MATLIPETALQYYLDAQDQNLKNYLRAISIRCCLENIFNTVFYHICGKNEVGKTKAKWNKSNLDQKIDMLKDYFPEDILTRVKAIKNLGNNGAHPELHELVTDQEIQDSLVDLSLICEWTIIAYFKKYGFNVHPWLPTILSTLPPENRIRILKISFENTLESLGSDYQKSIEKYQKILTMKQVSIDNFDFISANRFDQEFALSNDGNYKTFDQLHLLIDKLCMAYLKNNQHEDGIDFLEKCYNKKIISPNYRDTMLQKLENLKRELNYFNISKNIEDTRKNFFCILPSIQESEKSLFITLFISFLTQKKG